MTITVEKLAEQAMTLPTESRARLADLNPWLFSPKGVPGDHAALPRRRRHLCRCGESTLRLGSTGSDDR